MTVHLGSGRWEAGRLATQWLRLRCLQACNPRPPLAWLASGLEDSQDRPPPRSSPSPSTITPWRAGTSFARPRPASKNFASIRASPVSRCRDEAKPRWCRPRRPPARRRELCVGHDSGSQHLHRLPGVRHRLPGGEQHSRSSASKQVAAWAARCIGFASTATFEGSRRRLPRILHQPVLCMQCENAPCEIVCPVAATVHDDGGVEHDGV